jgi:hypothetical protein
MRPDRCWLTLGWPWIACALAATAGCAAQPGGEQAPDASADLAVDVFRAMDGNAVCPGDATGGTMTTNLSVPAVSGTVYTYTVGNTVFAVDAAKAGRIVTFSLAGKNILTAAKNSQDNNWGSTFWPSPQSAWNWPPPAELDPNPYTASLCGATAVMSSQTSALLGLSVTKWFSVDAATGAVTIQYGLVNHGTQARSVAPWEITRVAAGGLTFFPMGEGAPTKGPQTLLNLQIADGVAWFAYDAAAITSEQKVFADGSEGWIAHVDGNLLLVKAFTDTLATQAAPGEAEIELYTDDAHTYIEVENQGAYASVAPGATSTWTVRWFLRQLDATVSVQPGSADLLSLVRGLVKG